MKEKRKTKKTKRISGGGSSKDDSNGDGDIQ